MLYISDMDKSNVCYLHNNDILLLKINISERLKYFHTSSVPIDDLLIKIIQKNISNNK